METKARMSRQPAPKWVPWSVQENRVLDTHNQSWALQACPHTGLQSPPWGAYKEGAPIKVLCSDTPQRLAPGTPATLLPSQWNTAESTGPLGVCAIHSYSHSFCQYFIRTYYVLDPAARTRNAQLSRWNPCVLGAQPSESQAEQWLFTHWAKCCIGGSPVGAKMRENLTFLKTGGGWVGSGVGETLHSGCVSTESYRMAR